MKLYDFAKIILIIEKDGLSKVRFAKTIYFAHKELSRMGAINRDELQYIRMPLGPVPEGFMTLAEEHQDIITEIKESGLSYNSINYKLKRRLFFSPSRRNELYGEIEKILDDLRSISTSDLVEISHQEPSWISHSNSELYTISDKDMENPFPRMQRGKSMHLEDQQMQASLVKGMLEDIVSESTALEYPSDADKQT